jgi:sulfate adenylyltransferase
LSQRQLCDLELLLNRAFYPLFITGLSGSGKSTLAKVLYVRFMEMRARPVSLLAGDIVRKNLSSELNFSRDYRNLNVHRIGFVASEITKNRGIAICAPIAPYGQSRHTVREMILPYGDLLKYSCPPPWKYVNKETAKVFTPRPGPES